jgi:hypothetical protein
VAGNVGDHLASLISEVRFLVAWNPDSSDTSGLAPRSS